MTSSTAATAPRPERPDPDAPIRGHVRLAGFQRISHGLFRAARPELTPRQLLVRELEAWLLVLPEGACFTHLTAAVLLGWDVPQLPEGTPVWAAVTGDGPRPRRAGLIVSRLRRTRRRRLAHGLPVDETDEILLRCARDLGVLDLKILLESAVRCGDVDARRMEEILRSRRPGVRALRAVWRRMDPRAQSPGQAVLDSFHDAMGIAVEAQVEKYDDEGNLVARADFWVVGTNRLHEFVGGIHRTSPQPAVDPRRVRSVGDGGFVRRGFTLDDLLNHSLVVMHELDRALGRPHELRRHRRWRLVVEQSLYSPVGRERLLNRWHRQMGVHDWARGRARR